jgi:hypothetical protein
MSKTLKLQKWIILVLFQMSFLKTKCTPFLLKIRKDFNIDDYKGKRAKGFELMIISFITDLNTFGSKMFLTLKIMDLKNVPLTKAIYVYMIEGMNA